MVVEGPAEVLRGRRAERQVLERLLAAVRGGQSRLLVVSGGRVFFLHDGWTIADGRITVLPDDRSIRFEFGN